jgi:hypothetical protein
MGTHLDARTGVADLLTLAVASGVLLAGAGPPPTEELSLSIAAPREAEMSTWTDLRVEVENLGTAPAQVRVTVTLPLGRARPAAATGARCAGSATVECDLSLTGGRSTSVTFPVRWDGPGSRAVDARARSESGSSEAVATSTVSVYTLVLRGLRTTPSPAAAGRHLVATATLARSDTRAPLPARSLRCLAVTAVVPRGQPISTLRGRGTIRGARLACSWLIPRTARGLYIRATVLADTHPGGMTTKYPFVRRVR